MVENCPNYETHALEASLINKAMDWCENGNRINVPATINHGKKIEIAFSTEDDNPTWYFTEKTQEGSCHTNITLIVPSQGESHLSISQWDDFMGHMGMPKKYQAEVPHLERFNNLIAER